MEVPLSCPTMDALTIKVKVKSRGPDSEARRTNQAFPPGVPASPTLQVQIRFSSVSGIHRLLEGNQCPPEAPMLGASAPGRRRWVVSSVHTFYYPRCRHCEHPFQCRIRVSVCGDNHSQGSLPVSTREIEKMTQLLVSAVRHRGLWRNRRP
ncbi:hypothetical protein N656DRAFT_775417 [Canariomyces notabilis]|uniref:Uncharacterized protein n=1 Tax=Canariomyces notabilis TaxID=2074819 RepID=A0AAN6TJB0_9PEZI|nr:hypothetical protein N656DRAFT_775417 [Canariomyces arenarius]